MKHCFILGTRPEIIKLSPLIRLAQERALDFSIVHTNQHYTAALDAIFFKELKLPKADFDLKIGSSDHSTQTGKMLIALGRALREIRPDVVYVEGDTNTVLAGALAASKEGIRLAHVEAGLRSYDRSMPEELNRIVADHLSDFLFAPTERQSKILIGEGINQAKIHVTGNTIVDAVMQHKRLAELRPDPLPGFGLPAGRYAMLTMHRPGNVDDPVILQKHLDNLNAVAAELPVLFPVHPRTKVMIGRLKLKLHPQFKLVEPIGYLAMLRLMQHAKFIITDSGGIQEEACILQVPCITIRENTERPETLDVGSNVLVGSDRRRLLAAIQHFAAHRAAWKNPFGDGRAGAKMISIVSAHVGR